jgi:hypothetical protein
MATATTNTIATTMVTINAIAIPKTNTSTAAHHDL